MILKKIPFNVLRYKYEFLNMYITLKTHCQEPYNHLSFFLNLKHPLAPSKILYEERKIPMMKNMVEFYLLKC